MSSMLSRWSWPPGLAPSKASLKLSPLSRDIRRRNECGVPFCAISMAASQRSRSSTVGARSLMLPSRTMRLRTVASSSPTGPAHSTFTTSMAAKTSAASGPSEQRRKWPRRTKYRRFHVCPDALRRPFFSIHPAHDSGSPAVAFTGSSANAIADCGMSGRGGAEGAGAGVGPSREAAPSKNVRRRGCVRRATRRRRGPRESRAEARR
mmetsp:Transcript_13676/g.45621  ORF Transcript_13676/g.45621 Transcript_13676/m.45621 type:complete len:207 (+) Transcript_13676:429-1049(+)